MKVFRSLLGIGFSYRSVAQLPFGKGGFEAYFRPRLSWKLFAQFFEILLLKGDKLPHDFLPLSGAFLRH